MSSRDEKFFKKHEEEATINGLTIIDHDADYPWKLYKFNNCGHEQKIQPGHIRLGVFRCQICKSKEIENSFHERGIEIIEHISGHKKLIKFLKCQHEQIVTSINNLMCRTCQIERISTFCTKYGSRFIERCEDYRYATYELPCGHIQNVQIGNMNRGNFRCKTCFSSYTEKKSSVYILHVRSDIDNFEFLKLGFSLNVERRIKQITRNSRVSVRILKSADFETGKEAEKFETECHSKLKEFNICKTIVKTYLSDGVTECYKMDALVQLLNIFRDSRAAVAVLGRT